MDAARRASPRANLQAVHDYLAQGYLDHGDETFFAGVEKLPPAHSLTFGPRGLRLERYWSLERRAAPADPVAAVRETFVDAVRLELRSDVPVGTCLSGGIDSSAIATAVAHLGHDHQKTVTAYFEDAGFDERPYARAVVERTGAEAHWVSFTADDLVENLPAIVQAQGEPFGSTSICAGWYVMREAGRAGLKVMLDGQGGDEILAGYRAYFGYRLSDLLRQGRLREAGAELTAFGAVNGPRWAAVALVNPHVPERRAPGRARRGSAARRRSSTPSCAGSTLPADANGTVFPDRLRRQLQLVLTRRGLPELLRYEDRNSMAHSLEARVPFLDHRLVELMFSLDGGELIHRGETKSVLRRALADLLPPEVRKRRDKLGFVTPEARFLRGSLGALAADVFASRSFAERGFVDAPAARTAPRAAPERRAGRRLRALARAQPRALGAALPRPVKVLFLTTAYPTPESPVAGIFVKEHARAAALHADIAVVHLDRGGESPTTPRRVAGEEFPTWRVGYPRTPGPCERRRAPRRRTARIPRGSARRLRARPDPRPLLPRRPPRGADRPPLAQAGRRHGAVEHLPAVRPDGADRRSPPLCPVHIRARRSRASRERGAAARDRGRGHQCQLPDRAERRRHEPLPRGSNRRATGVTRLLAVGLLYEAKGYEFLLEAPWPAWRRRAAHSTST